MEKILVALDKSDLSQHVFEEALKLAKQSKAEMMLFHTLTQEEPGAPQMPILYGDSYATQVTDVLKQNYENAWQEFIKEYVEILEGWAATAKAAELQVEYCQKYGPPGPGICEVAETWEADLIVLGSHRRTGLQAMWMGSVSNYVTHHAPCSVLLVQAPKV
jgi:nucleotide-binding universal stress UspA family protein